MGKESGHEHGKGEHGHHHAHGGHGHSHHGRHHSHCTGPEDFVPEVKEPGCHQREELREKKKSLDLQWRRSTIKVSPCVHCASQEAHERARRYRAKAKCLAPAELLVCSMKLIESYRKKREPGQTPNVYADIWLPLYNVVHPYDIQTMKQILFGCVRYERLLRIFLDRMYEQISTLTFDDEMKYTVLAYLAFLRLHELSWPQYRRLVMSQPPGRMLPFMRFIFNERELIDHVQASWCAVYDIEFVRDILESIRFFSSEAQEVCEALEERVYAPDPLGRYVQPPTVPKPFKMSVSKTVCPNFEEWAPPEPFEARPAPMFEKGRTLEVKRLSAVFKENRQILKKKYDDPKHQPFRLRCVERPTNIEQLRTEVEEKFIQDHHYIPAEINPAPAMPTVEVKLNVATLLREHALFQKQMDQDKKKIEAFELELRDDSDFKLWQEEQRMQDEVADAINIEFNRKKVMATDQAAIEAKEKYLAEKMEIGRGAREEAKISHLTIQQESKNEKFRKKLKHFLVVQDKRGIKIARENVAKARKANALEVQAESEELCAKSTLQKAQEMAMKQELVRQLRALEKESCHMEKKFDIYSSSGQGLLQEMSIAQLRTELVLVKRWLQHEEDIKRRKIHAVKIERQNMLLERSRVVTQMRHIARAQWLSKKAHEKFYDKTEINPAEQLGL
ncbi:cilia- and flagella-associated protein 99 [Marchantia polymorpha subsp. ruderalis]